MYVLFRCFLFKKCYCTFPLPFNSLIPLSPCKHVRFFFLRVLLKCDYLAFFSISLIVFYILLRRLFIFSFLRAFYIVYIHRDLAIMCVVVIAISQISKFCSQHAHSWWGIKQSRIFYSATHLGLWWKVTKTGLDSYPWAPVSLGSSPHNRDCEFQHSAPSYLNAVRFVNVWL